MKEAKFDAVAEHYDAARGGERRGRRQARQLMTVLRMDVPAVEIGVGTGVVALGLAGFGYEVLGVDLSLEMSRAARRRLGARVAVADAMSLPFPDGALTQAYSALVLHHMLEIPAMLREVCRVLRSGGRYVVLPGGDEPVGDLHPAFRLIDGLVRRVAPEMRQMPGNADDLPQMSEGTGLRVARVVPLEAHSYTGTTEDLARAIADRAFPYLRGLDDDLWRRVVEPTIAAIRALPDDDRAVQQRVRPRSMVVMERA